MTPTASPSKSDDRSPDSLEDRLRVTLRAARGNLRVRERLVELVSDPARFDPIVREFGPSHSLVRALLEIGRHGQVQRVGGAWGEARS